MLQGARFSTSSLSHYTPVDWLPIDTKCHLIDATLTTCHGVRQVTSLEGSKWIDSSVCSLPDSSIRHQGSASTRRLGLYSVGVREALGKNFNGIGWLPARLSLHFLMEDSDSDSDSVGDWRVEAKDKRPTTGDLVRMNFAWLIKDPIFFSPLKPLELRKRDTKMVAWL